MKIFLIALTVLLISPKSFAAKKSWACVFEDRADAEFVSTLKLPGYLRTIEVLSIESKYCKSDYLCSMKGHTIEIGRKTIASTLITTSGREIRMQCEEILDAEPYPSHGGN